ncbi:FAD:protein FMN transferase [Thalassotalea sp. M1531]|uniref:FAD:protein FMN transferase n=1 Tax=Thalassotalea algicola TaxID=2716224 RepID=A0A7Y0L9T6_9GAMM|nr:FAD:protein FMN transferase [Thalassotalea algicola]NMP30600.1 FAD:protein FMN transferase [Thalassotalea algicola]
MHSSLFNTPLSCLFAFMLLASNSVSAQWIKHSFQVMGTQAHVEFWFDEATSPENSAERLVKIIEVEMNRIDRAMSPYKPDSELSKVNRLASTQPVKITRELMALLQVSHNIAQLTEGAFDITYASIGYQYDYRKKQKPNQTAINDALDAINYQGIKLNTADSSVYFLHPQIKIDLGGIAKGYAVKQCIELLSKQGIKHALVSAGGDTGLLGDRRGRPWYVGIKHPRAEDKAAVHLPLTDEAISTSGDYERYFMEDGVRYHHIINPKTGDSARKVVSVSIIGQDSTYVDALSTAVFVKGLQQGLALINRLPEYEAIIIDNKQTLHASNGLQ